MELGEIVKNIDKRSASFAAFCVRSEYKYELTDKDLEIVILRADVIKIVIKSGTN